MGGEHISDEGSLEELSQQVVNNVLNEAEQTSNGTTPREESEGNAESLTALSEVAAMMMGPVEVCEQCNKQIASNMIDDHKRVWCTAINSSWLQHKDMAIELVAPLPFLQDLVGKHVVAKLKWGHEYRGLLAAVDAYMNLQLAKCEEWSAGTMAGHLGDVLIRCNNILYVRGLPEDEDIDAKDEED